MIESVVGDFFDKVCERDDIICGLGGILYFLNTLSISFKANGGKGSNNKAKYQALRTLLKTTIGENVKDLKVFGDSSLVVD